MSDPLHDDEFRPSHEIRFSAPTNYQRSTNVYAYSVDEFENTGRVNVEFVQEAVDGLPYKIVDAYFFAEDLERLGVLFQYLGKVAREARDGTA